MNRENIVDAVMRDTGLTRRNSEFAVNATFRAMYDALSSGDSVHLNGFGNFEIKKRAARTGRNPRTNQPVYIDATYATSFTPCKELKQAVAACHQNDK